VSRILICEDEEHLALGLRFNLENAGYQVLLVPSGEEALKALGEGEFDLAILDVMLPGSHNGFDVARAIRREGNFMPIIMLTAREAVQDRVEGLDAGADDYLTKPFDLDELMARVRGHLRRQVWSRRNQASDPGAQGGEVGQRLTELAFGRCHIDFRTYRARTHAGAVVQLSDKEARMMRLFAEREGEVISRVTFLETVWGEPGTLETRTIDNFILRLRKHFEPDPKHPRHILSVRGVGYRFVT